LRSPLLLHSVLDVDTCREREEKKKIKGNVSTSGKRGGEEKEGREGRP